jgi:hypothetical protein
MISRHEVTMRTSFSVWTFAGPQNETQATERVSDEQEDRQGKRGRNLAQPRGRRRVCCEPAVMECWPKQWLGKKVSFQVDLVGCKVYFTPHSRTPQAPYAPLNLDARTRVHPATRLPPWYNPANLRPHVSTSCPRSSESYMN